MTDGRPAPTRRSVLRSGGTLALAAGLAGCVLSTEPYARTEERSFDPGSASSLVVTTGDGDVTLSPGDGSAVSGTVRTESRSGRDALSAVSVEGTVDDGTLRIEPAYPDRDVDVSVHLDLSVPEGLAVERAATTDGDVAVTDLPGDVTCATENGDATAEGVDGFVTVRTTNGDATARETAGVDGAATTNGDVTAEVRAVRGDVALENVNGDVTAAVAPDLGAAVELETVNGEADVLGLDPTTTDAGERRISGRLGGSDPAHTLSLATTNGDVTLRSL